MPRTPVCGRPCRRCRIVQPVFIVAQRASSILHADQILVLDDGQIVGMGTHQELLDSCDIYREIYETQYKKEA